MTSVQLRHRFEATWFPLLIRAVDEWDRSRPLVLDAKVDPTIVAEWLEEAFRAG